MKEKKKIKSNKNKNTHNTHRENGLDVATRFTLCTTTTEIEEEEEEKKKYFLTQQFISCFFSITFKYIYKYQCASYTHQPSYTDFHIPNELMNAHTIFFFFYYVCAPLYT